MTRVRSLNSGAFRFALLTAGLIAVGALILRAVVERTLGAYAQEVTVVGLRSESLFLREGGADPGHAELIEAIGRRQRSPFEQPFRYLLVDARGRRLAGDLPPTAAVAGWNRTIFIDGPENRGDATEAETLRTLGTRLDDGSLLVVGTDAFDVQKLRRRVGSVTVWTALGTIALSLIGGYAIGLVFLRRLERVNAAAARIMDGHLSERLPVIGMSPEFSHLSRTLNRMLDQIALLIEGVRHVSTNIAHDLRTPLTRLQHRLEGLRGSPTSELYEAGIEQALEQIGELHAIFRALLKIGLIEGGGHARALPRIDLSALVERVAAAYQPALEDAGRAFTVAIAPGLRAPGDEELLTQALVNLLDNALVHTPAGTAIALTLAREGLRAVLTVADRGSGVPADQRAKILTRFYRLDASRHTPGAGLGLALVAAIATLHRAELLIDDNRPGLRARLRLDQAPPRP